MDIEHPTYACCRETKTSTYFLTVLQIRSLSTMQLGFYKIKVPTGLQPFQKHPEEHLLPRLLRFVGQIQFHVVGGVRLLANGPGFFLASMDCPYFLVPGPFSQSSRQQWEAESFSHFKALFLCLCVLSHLCVPSLRNAFASLSVHFTVM